jgi:hypothetical protein
MYRAKEQASSAGLYRCTTCGVIIPLNAGETLPRCPSHCPDVIWTFFNEKWTAPPAEIREVTQSFQALDLNGDPRLIPAGVRLTDVRLGPRLASRPGQDPSLAAFQFEAQVFFGSAHELFKKTEVIRS